MGTEIFSGEVTFQRGRALQYEHQILIIFLKIVYEYMDFQDWMLDPGILPEDQLSHATTFTDDLMVLYNTTAQIMTI